MLLSPVPGMELLGERHGTWGERLGGSVSRSVDVSCAQEMFLWEISDDVEDDFSLQAVGGEVPWLSDVRNWKQFKALQDTRIPCRSGVFRSAFHIPFGFTPLDLHTDVSFN